MKNLYRSATELPQTKFNYRVGSAESASENYDYPSTVEVQTAMNSTIRPGEKSRAAYILLKALEGKYGTDKGILSKNEKQNKNATVGPNGLKYLKEFQKNHVPYFRDGNNAPDGIAEAGKSTWRCILDLVSNAAPQKAKVSQQTHDDLEKQAQEMGLNPSTLTKDGYIVLDGKIVPKDTLGGNRPNTVQNTKENSTEKKTKTNVTIDIPQWFIDADNDVVRVATINRISPYFGEFAKRTDRGGNEATVAKQLSAKFVEKCLLSNKNGEAQVTLQDLKEWFPGQNLNDEDYIALIANLDAMGDVVDKLGKTELKQVRQSLKGVVKENKNAALQNDEIYYRARLGNGKDLPLKVKVLDKDAGQYEVTTRGDGKNLTRIQLSADELNNLARGRSLSKEGKNYVQAQGRVYEVAKGEDKLKIFSAGALKGRDIHLTRELYDSVKLNLDDGPNSNGGAIKEKATAQAIKYLVETMDSEDLDKYLRVKDKEKGKDWLYVRSHPDVQKVILAAVQASLVEDYTLSDNDGTEYSVVDSNLRAQVHKAYAEIIKDKPAEKQIQWAIRGIANSDWDNRIEGATVTKKLKLLGIPVGKLERELSRDEFVTNGAKTDYFEVFERRIHTDLDNLVKDGVFNNTDKYKGFEDQVVAMGKVSWEEEGGKAKNLSEAELRNIWFRRGSFQLLELSEKRNTSLATEYKRLYEGKTSELISDIEDYLEQPNADQTKVLESMADLQDTFRSIQSLPGMDNTYAQISDSGVQFGINVVRSHGSVDLPESTRELVSEAHSSNTEHTGTETNSSVDTSVGGWEEVKTGPVREEIRDGKLYTYQDVEYRRRVDQTTTTVTERNYTTTNGVEKVYKVTQYHEEKPDERVEFTIDTRSNMVNLVSMPGLDLNLQGGLGGVLNDLSDTGYLSLGIDAKGCLTPKTKFKAGIGSKYRLDGQVINAAHAELKHEVNDNLKIFGGLRTNALDSWSEVMNLDQAVKYAGFETGVTKNWDLVGQITKGSGIEQLSVVLKKNQDAFIREFKEVVANVSDEEADAHTKAIYGDRINGSEVEALRDEAKLFLGGLAYSKAIRGDLTKAGFSFANIQDNEVFSVILGFATRADVIKHVSPHGTTKHEAFRGYLQQSGDFVSKLRHSQSLDINDLSLGGNQYRILPEGYAEQFLPTNVSNDGKFVELNVYVDPAIKDQVSIQADGTFEFNGQQLPQPFVLNKTLADGHTEINVHFGDFEASNFDSANRMTSGRVFPGGSFQLREGLNAGFDKTNERVEGIQQTRKEKVWANAQMERSFLNAMKDPSKYQSFVAIEQAFRIKDKAQDTAFTNRVGALSELDLDSEAAKSARTLDTYANGKNLSGNEIISAMVKARMRHDAIQTYGENWDKMSYNQAIDAKRAYGVKHADKWKSAFNTLGNTFGFEASQLAGLDNASTALRQIDQRNDADSVSLSGGLGYIMGPNGEPVLLNELNATKVMHPKSVDISTPTGNYRVTTGYLEQCRNASFFIQRLDGGGNIVSDQENTGARNGIDVKQISIALGLTLTPPRVGSTTTYENQSSSSQEHSSNSSSQTDRDSYYEYRTDTIVTCEPIKEEPPVVEEPDPDPVF